MMIQPNQNCLLILRVNMDLFITTTLINILFWHHFELMSATTGKRDLANDIRTLLPPCRGLSPGRQLFTFLRSGGLAVKESWFCQGFSCRSEPARPKRQNKRLPSNTEFSSKYFLSWILDNHDGDDK